MASTADAQHRAVKIENHQDLILRSTMSQERLDGLAIISIEHECAKDTDFDLVIKEFTMKLARARKFGYTTV